MGLAFAAIAAGAAAAAPLWLERRFIRDAELLDPKFAVAEAASEETVDHAVYGAFLESYLKVGDDGVNRVAYGDVTDADKAALDGYLSSLEGVDPQKLAPAEQLAFWINAYNAETINLIIENYPVESIRDIDDAWGQPVMPVSGTALTLDDIEHGIIRPTANDPRIHYAVNCASIGCPNLAPTPYAGENVEAMHDAAARDYANHPRGIRVEDGEVTASKIYGWYREDFGRNEAEVLDHIRQYAEPDVVSALEGERKIDAYEYDWNLNDATAN
ncbi:MAG: DUF547 domain-containing protein [Parvularculaceae bacterium]